MTSPRFIPTRNWIALSGDSRAHRRLNLGGARDCVHNTGKLGKHAIAGEFDDATAMLGDLGIDYCLPDFLQLRERPGFVIAHQPAVPDDIGSENCSETAFHFVNKQSFERQSRNPVMQSLS